MTRYGLSVCGVHGGYAAAARMGLRRATRRMLRDEDWAAKWGAPREDIENARKIIGEGTGWVDRIEAALKSGAILPATAAALFAAASAAQQEVRGGPS